MKEIKTKRLLIREALAEEIPMLIELESHPSIRDYIWIGTEKEHQDEIKDPNHLLLVFYSNEENKSDKQALWNPEKEGYKLVTADVKGYALIRLDFKSNIFEIRRIAITEKGVGYGKEAMKALIRYAFEEADTNRLWLDVYPDNKIGIALYESLGMHCDGILRQNYKAERGYMDQIIYSLLKNEYIKM